MRSVKHSMMRRRRWLPAAFCLLCCLLFSGCTPGATVDSLLKPPSLSKEQQQIYLALQDAVGSGITLQYPRAGANLSAFTVVDLDNDGEDEALVFYKKTSLTAMENGLRLSVLDQVKGEWMSVCDRPADGTEVERIVISPMGSEDSQNQIFVGYSGVDQSDKSLTVYRYSDSEVQQLFTAAYTMFDVADLDGDQAQELLVLGKLTENTSSSAAMYRLQNGTVKDNGKLDLRTGFTDFSQVQYGRLEDGTTGIYIDLLAANGSPPRTGRNAGVCARRQRCGGKDQSLCRLSVHGLGRGRQRGDSGAGAVSRLWCRFLRSGAADTLAGRFRQPAARENAGVFQPE